MEKPRLATERRSFLIPLPPEVDILERDAVVVYVARPGEPVEVVLYQIPGMVPVRPDGMALSVLEELATGHEVFTKGRDNGTD